MSLDIGQISDGDISDLRISGQSLIKENCHNSRASDDIDMKLGPVTKLEKKTRKRQKKNYFDDVMPVSCDVNVIFEFIANLKQSGSRIQSAEYGKLTF